MTFLEHLDPKVAYLAVAGLTFLLVWAWRRFLPGLWDAVTKKGAALQQLPAVVLAALLSTAPALGKPLWEAVQQVIISTVLGWLSATGFHVFAKDVPVIPYDGARKALGRPPVEAQPPGEPPPSPKT
ncbi:MAG: hypothetical protein V4537_14420 [Pseudomonadota bacterium]